MAKQIFQVYLGSSFIASDQANKILNKLNSLNSATEIMQAIGIYSNENVVGMRIAQRILKAKLRAGKFQNLNQIATVPGIGSKRFSNIMSALSDRA